MPITLLLVDDDTNILETAQDILDAAGGFSVRTASAGAAALQSLKDHACELMIVDFNLLDMTGLELALKAKEIRPELAILLMTGEASVDLGAAKAIIHSTLTKPVNPAQLIEIIHKIVDP